MAQYNFGLGSLTLIPPSGSTDISPLPVGVLKDVTLDISFTMKELVGSLGFPVDVARGPAKLAGKSKFAQIRGGLISSVLAGSSIATGSKLPIFNEANTLAAGTYTVANGANFIDDLGVTDTSGNPYTRVLSAPTGTQYTVSVAGVYTFNATQNGTALLYSYSYNSAGTGKTVTYNNQTMGANIAFQLALFSQTTRAGTVKTFGVKLFAVAVPKIAFALKNEDYTEQDLDLMAFADATGRVLEAYTAE